LGQRKTYGRIEGAQEEDDAGGAGR